MACYSVYLYGNEHRKPMVNLWQIISLLLLAPFFFGVFFFCPFKIPYLYCFICPVRCLWYRTRGIVLLIALGLNMNRDLFCNRICPFGTIQVLLSKFNLRKIALPPIFGGLKYIAVILIASIAVMTKISQPLFVVKLKDLLWVMFLTSVALSIFSYRFFCHNLCPIKALSAVLDKVRRR